jgi:8-oxo-dGTP pyrophosphatase MutT (NUDIX family)
MVREISAGGVVVRFREGVWWMAAIEPADAPATSGRSNRAANRAKTVLALPKGLVDPGEKPLESALREVYEETGVTAEPVTINDIAPAMRVEVARASWVRLEDAAALLAYKGEKQMARRALEYVEAHAEL